MVSKLEINKQTVSSTPGGRLKMLRTQLKLTRAYICQTYGLSIDTLRAWESDKINLTEKGLNRCINLYRNEGIVVSKSWILTGEGLDPRMSFEIGKYFNQVGNTHKSEEVDDSIWMIKEADFFKNTTPNAIVLLVSTEEMLPFYAPGDYVGGRFQSGEKAEELLGKDCIVLTRTGEKYFRRLSKSSIDGSYNLVCHNPIWGSTLEPVIFNIQVEHIAPVIWHRRASFST